MPTSLSLQDLRRGEKLHQKTCRSDNDNNCYQQQYFHQQLEFIEDFDNSFVEENVIAQDLINRNENIGRQHVDVGDGNDNMPMSTQNMQNVPIDDHYGMDIGSEQVIIESINEDVQEELIDVDFHQQELQHKNKDCHEIEITTIESQQNAIEVEGKMFKTGNGDLPLFEHSQIGLYEFSTEFLALIRKHRLIPKVRAILLDLLRQTMPQENCCPLTVINMRKMVSHDGRMHWFGTSQGSSLPSSSKTMIHHQTVQANQMHHNIESKDMPSTSQTINYTNDKGTNEYIGEEYYQAVDEYVEEEIVDSQDNLHQDMVQYPTAGEIPLILPKIVETINHLSNEIAYLRSQIEFQSHRNAYGTVRKLKKRVHDGRFGLHIYNEHNQKVLLSQLSNGEIINTVEISRLDENRLIYGVNDITELVLEKIDLSAYIHNPSLCGRMVADVLFSPEYLADKHILGEGQVSSRTRLETLPPEMTQLFYDTLRKLGVSRILEDDQEHWLYLARDGVNQRARDLKANRKRKFYIDDQPVFGEEEQYQQ